MKRNVSVQVYDDEEYTILNFELIALFMGRIGINHILGASRHVIT
ncbi:16579_t:CDS:2 [Funneliformis caledonium]|uniref:16579_t:CDS:1 n=1 Tax=Funneliformis caledonium TaxID=1117310 RepID=A0A9N9EVX3_9GLOM|nr:16579_t:CDS:2 [Funneliformis caledonium]